MSDPKQLEALKQVRENEKQIAVLAYSDATQKLSMLIKERDQLQKQIEDVDVILRDTRQKSQGTLDLTERRLFDDFAKAKVIERDSLSDKIAALAEPLVAARIEQELRRETVIQTEADVQVVDKQLAKIAQERARAIDKKRQIESDEIAQRQWSKANNEDA